MKKNLIIAIAATVLTAGATPCNAQTTKTSQEQKSQPAQPQSQQTPVYEQNQVEQPAAFPGGIEKQMKFMMQNLKYPETAEKDGASGTVRVHFIIETDGSLTNIKVKESIHPALDAEGIRVVKAMPKWTPAKLHGKAVRQSAIITIPFWLK